MKIRLVISGRSYDAAEEVPEELTLAESCSIGEALRAVGELLPDERQLPDSCLIAVSGTHLGTLSEHRPHELSEGEELVIIAPVAGG